MFTEFMEKLDGLINTECRESYVTPELVDYGEGYLDYLITWGDWKHDHLRFKWIVDELCMELKIPHVITSRETEENGSDCYSAIHRVRFVETNI